MVCTGNLLIYGIEMSIYDIIKYVLKYFKSYPSIKSYEEIKSELEDGEIYDQIMLINKLFESNGFSINVIKPRCCLSNIENFYNVYLGVELYENSIISRWNPYVFSNLDDYMKLLTRGFELGKQKLEENQQNYTMDFIKILPKTKITPKFYSLPNDCFSCT